MKVNSMMKLSHFKIWQVSFIQKYLLLRQKLKLSRLTKLWRQRLWQQGDEK